MRIPTRSPAPVFVLTLLLTISACDRGEVEMEKDVGPLTDIEVEVKPDGTTEIEAEPALNWNWGPYAEWEIEGAGIDRQEFERGFPGIWARWDPERAGQIDRDAWADVWAQRWDLDRDGTITEDEWRAATNYWNAEAWGWGDFDAWDMDTDQGLTEEEFRQGFGQNAFSAWDEDGDGVIREGEARQVFFAWWDADQDGVITQEEWNRS